MDDLESSGLDTVGSVDADQHVQHPDEQSRERSARHNRKRTVSRPLIAGITVVVVAGAAGALATFLHKSSSDGGNLVTTAAAAGALKAYWPVHEQALVDGDLAKLASLDADSAAEWEKGAVACGCYHIDEPRPLKSASYLIPKQTAYPAFFMAEATETYQGVDHVDLLVFTKQNAQESWLVSEESGFSPSVIAASKVAPAAGNAAAPTAAQHARATKAAADLATFWQEAKNNSDLPDANTFDTAGQTGQRLASLMASGQDEVQGNGLLGHYTFSASSTDPLFEVTTADGSDLACQPLRESVVYTPPPGYAVHQDADQHEWGKLLPPGDYASLTSRDAWQTCFLISPNAQDSIVVFDSDTGGATPTGTAIAG